MKKIDIVEKIGEIKDIEFEFEQEMKDYVKDKLNSNKFNVIYTNNDDKKISIITDDSIIVELTQSSTTRFNIDKVYLAGKIGDHYVFEKIHQWDNLFICLQQAPFCEWFNKNK